MVELRRFDDVAKTRQLLHRAVQDGFAKRFPMDGKFTRLTIDNVAVDATVHYTKAQQKQAILNDQDLSVPVKGVVTLFDKATGAQLDSRKMVLGHLPYLTDERGTFIGNGTEFSVANQMRLLPGAYTRVKNNGEIETQFNIDGGAGFRVGFDPTGGGQFKLITGTNKLQLYPILHHLGIPDEVLKAEWGEQLLAQNKTKRGEESVDRFYKRLAGRNYLPNLQPSEAGNQLKQIFTKLKMDPEVNKLTLGIGADQVTPQALLRATTRITDVYQGKADPDDRDSLLFKSFHGVEDFIKERIEKDSGNLSHKLMLRLDKFKTLDKMPSGYFSKQLKNIVRGDSRAFPLEEINPIQLYDNMHRNIITGEGGIGSLDMVTKEARNVNPSQFGFVDPVRGPESANIGIDTRFSYLTHKGDDKKIYARFDNAKTGAQEFLNPLQVFQKTVAFPFEMGKPGDTIRAMRAGKIQYVKKSEVDYALKSPDQMFSVYSNLVPMVSSNQGNRLLMAGKAIGDTLPLTNPEAPVVRSQFPENPNHDFETHYARKILADVAPIAGKITKITADEVHVTGANGDKHVVELYNNFPLSRKTSITSSPTVKLGDTVKEGQQIVRSNYTDDKGTMAAGRHLNTAYLPYKGYTHEDGVVLSESAAKKLTSEQTYKFELPIDEHTILARDNFANFFPGIYHKDQVGKIELNGMPKVGTIINPGDPLMLAMKKKLLTAKDVGLGKLHKAMRNKYDDVSLTWEHGHPGEIVDVVHTGNTAKIYVKTQTPAELGDKLTGRYGNKGVISLIVPDHEMPLVKRTGERLDMALNPAGVVSRINPAQIWEGLLGKVSLEASGKVYRQANFMNEPDGKTYYDFVKSELAKHNIPAEEELVDPVHGSMNAMVTRPYFYKLSKLSEGIMSAREMSSYTANLQPAKGKMQKGQSQGMIMGEGNRPIEGKEAEGGAIKVGTMELAALLGHGAKYNLRDMTLVKGQKNDEYWRALKMGYPLPTPDVPFVYKKFMAMLQASGANVDKLGDMINIMPMTDRDTTALSRGEIKNTKTLVAKDLTPEPGGLFDTALTGGIGGNKWTHIDLATPIPSPIMELPIKALLGLNDDQFQAVLTNKHKLPNGKTGMLGMRDQLAAIDTGREISRLKTAIPAAKQQARDKMLKQLKYLIGIEKSGHTPGDLMITKVPVIPPVYRPITAMEDKGTVTVSDANYLYRDLLHANDVYRQLSKDLHPDNLGDEQATIYHAMKAVAGLGDPITVENQQDEKKGFVRKIVGDQPKSGFFFDKVISKTQDLVGRSVVAPDNTLSMDEVSIPQEMAWKIYRPFVMRQLVRRGMPAVSADQFIENKHPIAMDTLRQSMAERPVIMNRAPSLHKFSLMAFYPKLNQHKHIGVSPLIEGPFGMDYDGDAVQIHVPASEEARQEALAKMLPSKNLFSMKDYRTHYLPTQEDNLGLYQATTKTNGLPPVKFGSVGEMQAALKSGKIRHDTVVDVPT